MGSGAWTLPVAFIMMVIAAPTHSQLSCNCLFHHPQAISCKTDFAIKGQFLNVSGVILPTYPNYTYPGFNIKAEKVFKGNISKGVFFAFNFAPSPCEYILSPHNFHRDYLITVSRGKSLNYLSICCFIKPWSKLSSGQLKGFKGGYTKECGCEVITCFKPPCPTTNKQCAFLKYDESVRLHQERNQICAQNKHGDCIWKNIV